MDAPDTRMLLCDVARDIVADIAPQELPIFPAVSSAWLADPDGAIRRRRRGEAALGFGLEAIFTAATVGVLFVLTAVIKALAEAAVKAVAEGLEREATAFVKAMFKRFRQPGQAPLPRNVIEAQLATVRATVVSAGREMHLPEDQIEVLVKAVTAQLVVPE